MDDVTIRVDKTGIQVIIDGKDVSQKAEGINIDLSAHARPQVTVSYACYDQMTIEGEFEVAHVCPKKARE